jgi:DNA processing protein
MDNAAIRPWLASRAIAGVGDATLLALVQSLGSPQAVMAASEDVLIGLGCRRDLAVAIRGGLNKEENRRIDDEIRTLDRLGVTAVTYLDTSYPTKLRTIPDPPAVLYMTGRVDHRDDIAIAIVGARRGSHVGRMITEELSRELASAGFTIVSGLAMGVDAAAHRGALAAQGRTLAVLGCGIDRTYPPDHASLRRKIEEHGAVLSELPVGAPPHSHHFPRRNRIISGLSLGVVVTEAAMNSGSLITARLAADQGREVFAIPGTIRAETSRGPNGLIKEGAKLVESARDIIEELLPQLDDDYKDKLMRHNDPGPNPRSTFGNDEALVYDALSYESQGIDAVIRKTGLSASQVTTALLGLELKNHIRQLPGNEYVRL